MAYERTLEDIECFVFDLDGTIWEWNRLKGSVKETIKRLRKADKELYFLTNNAMLRRGQYAEKLSKLGIDVEPERVISSSYVAAQVFDNEDIRKAFVVGEEGLMNELKEKNISHRENAHHVLVSMDRNFSYWKLSHAADLVRDGAGLWVTGNEPYWWAGDRHMPGTNALCGAICEAAGVGEPELIGKPSTYVQDVVKSEWGLRPGNTVMIGDSLRSDVAFGKKMGFSTALVLGGESTEEDVRAADKKDMPDLVFRSFTRIPMKI